MVCSYEIRKGRMKSGKRGRKVKEEKIEKSGKRDQYLKLKEGSETSDC